MSHQQSGYQYAQEPRADSTESDHKVNAHQEHHFQRSHREPGQLELGLTEVAEGRTDVQRNVVATAGLDHSRFRSKWQTIRPDWLSAVIGEALGVFFFTFMGTAATALFVLSAVAGTEYGSFLNIALSYAFGIVFGIYMAGLNSGAHLHPAVTICQVIFKGFPISRAPLYIVAQIFGGYIGALCTIAINRTPIFAYEAGLRAAGESAAIFTSAGPAGIIALFPAAGRTYGDMVTNEIIGAFVIGLVIWANLDSQNIFTSPVNAPWAIGLAYFVVVSSQAPGAIALNTARDVGARFACASVFGRECFQPSKYTALAALTNIPVTIFAAGLYTFFLSDSRRPSAGVSLSHHLEQDRKNQLAAESRHEELMLQRTRTGSGGDKGGMSLFRTITGRGAPKVE